MKGEYTHFTQYLFTVHLPLKTLVSFPDSVFLRHHTFHMHHDATPGRPGHRNGFEDHQGSLASLAFTTSVDSTTHQTTECHRAPFMR